jgi:hypothetical protein
MFGKQSIRTACWLAGALGVLVYPAPQLQAQTIIAQITGAPTWQKGSQYTVTWNITGTPAAIVTQYGVKVFAVSMAGSNTNYGLTPQASAFSARQTTISANLTYTSSTAMQIVLEDTNGNRLTNPYSLTFVVPVTTPTPPPPPVSVPGNPAFAAAACTYVFGMGCTGSYAQFGPYLVQSGSGAPMFPTQAAMQAYLIDYVVGTNPGVKSDIISRAAGSPAPCTGALNTLNNAFTGNPSNPQGNGLWNSYTQLAAMAPAVVKSQCTVAPPPPVTWTAQQHDQALAAAVALLIGATNPAGQAVTLSAADTALFATTAPANIQGLMMSVIKNEPALRAQIVDNMYFAAYHTPDTAAAQSQILAQYGIRWSAANDLFPFLQANAALYNAPTWTAAQQSQALTAAVAKLMGTVTPAGQAVTLTAAQYAMFASTAPANMESQMRSAIRSDTNWQGQIVDNMFYAAFKKSDTAFRSQILSLYGVKWTAGDDLFPYLTANAASYNASATSANLTAAVNSAFATLALQPPTAVQMAALNTPQQAAAMGASTDPAAMYTPVRGYIRTDTTLQGQIVDNAYKSVYSSAPVAAMHTTVLQQYGSHWTAADDLQAFLTANKYTYAPPVTSTAPGQPASGGSNLGLLSLNGVMVKPTGFVDRILVNVNGTPLYLPTQLGGKCMTVEGNITGSTTYSGARIIGYQCQAVPQARFVFMNNGQLRDHDGSNMCLDLNGAQVVTKPCSSLTSQQWNLLGTGAIENVATGMCMDLIGGQQSWFLDAVQRTFNWQQPVQVMGCNNSAEQQWVASQNLGSGANQSPPNSNVIQPGQLAAVSNVVAGVVSNDGGSIVAAGAGNIVAAGAGNIVAAGAGNLKMVAIGGAIVAAGAGNIVAAGAGNIVAAGAGNIVAAGAGNIILIGGSNVVNTSGSNLVGPSTGTFAVMIPLAQANIVAAGAGNVVRLDLGAGIISLPYQGGSLVNANSTMLMPISSMVSH